MQYLTVYIPDNLVYMTIMHQHDAILEHKMDFNTRQTYAIYHKQGCYKTILLHYYS